MAGLAQLSDGAGQLADGARHVEGAACAGWTRAPECLAAGAADAMARSGQLRAGAGDLSTGLGKVDAGARKLAAGAGDAKDGADQIATGANDLATGVESAANGSSRLKAGLDEAAAGAPELVKGAQRLSDEGTKKLVEAGTSTAQSYGEMYATMTAGAERAKTESMAFGAPTGAIGLTAYNYVIQGDDGESGRNWARGVGGLAILGAGAGAFALRRRMV